MALLGGLGNFGRGVNPSRVGISSNTSTKSNTVQIPNSTPQFSQARCLPGGRLKILKRRKKTVQTIGKLTKTMSVVAASKMAPAAAKAEAVSPFFTSMIKPIEQLNLKPNDNHKVLLLVVASDKGLCGATNNNLTRTLLKENLTTNTLVILGDKGCGAFERSVARNNVLFSAHPNQKTIIDFIEVSSVAERLMQEDFDILRIAFNRMIKQGHPSHDNLYLPSYKYLTSDEARNALIPYEFEATANEELLRSYSEFLITAGINYAVFHNQNVEIYNRQVSMDNASKNAKEISKVLSLKVNRERQAIITTELGEITSGAAAVDEMR